MLLGAAGLGQKCGAGSVLEHLTDTLVGLGRALEVLVGTDLLADLLSLLRSNWLLGSLVELLDGLLVVTEILLTSNKDDWQTLAEMKDLRDPLLLDVVKGIWGVDGEANQDNVGVWVGEWAKTIVIFLASSIPQGQLNVLSIDLDIGNIVLEDSWDVDLWEGSLGENNQQAGLSAGTIANNDELATDLRHFGCGFTKVGVSKREKNGNET